MTAERAPTLAAALARTVATLRDAAIEDAPAEARRLVAAAAGIEAIDLLIRGDVHLTPDVDTRIAGFARRRAAREPLSRILGVRAFYGRDFALSPGTLDPRPDTEILVDLALEFACTPPLRDHPLRILDVGTGTGAILITLLAELSRSSGLGIDISEDALATAAANARALGVADRAQFASQDVREGLSGSWDLIVSNPPYIPSDDIAGLAPEVRCHDPLAALDGGDDGLEFYRVLATLLHHLAPGGWLAVEVGAGQSVPVQALLLQHAPDAIIRTAADLASHMRVVAVQPRPRTGSE